MRLVNGWRSFETDIDQIKAAACSCGFYFGENRFCFRSLLRDEADEALEKVEEERECGDKKVDDERHELQQEREKHIEYRCNRIHTEMIPPNSAFFPTTP